MSEFLESVGVDLRVERELLATHDLTAMHARLQTTLRRRAALAYVSIVLVGVTLAGAASIAMSPHASATAPPPAPVLTAPTVTAPVAPPAVSLAAPVEPPLVAPVPRTPHGARAPVAASAPAEAPTEVSPLRAQLALYDAARAAKDPLEGHALLVQLRAEHPDGPLAIEAGLLDVRMLMRAHNLRDARALLAELEVPAANAGKHVQWRQVKAALADADDDQPSRVLR